MELGVCVLGVLEKTWGALGWLRQDAASSSMKLDLEERMRRSRLKQAWVMMR